MNHMKTVVKVWDVPVRLFHWSLVLSFAAAYFTAQCHLGFLHIWIGYFLCVLLLTRIVWGFAGNQYARFRAFVFSPAETMSYLRAMLQGHPKPYLGHNPAGALMVFALLGTLALVFMSGLATLSVIDFEGPLLYLANYVDDETSYTVRHVHAWLVNIVLVLIPLHLLGVLIGSLQHKENLVRAMITGEKDIAPACWNKEKK